MALGDGNNNNQNYDPTYFSRIRFKNDGLSLGFSFWKGLLKISITKAKETGSGYEFDELAYIHLSPLRAKELSDVLKDFVNRPYNEKNMFGVDAGSSDTRNIIVFGVDHHTSTKDSIKRYVIVGKVSPDGNLIDPVRFDFNSDYHFSIEWKDLDKMDCSKVYNNDLEINMFIHVLDQFYLAMTGAMSYSVMDMGRFDNSRLNTKIGLIMDKLGIERAGGNKTYTGGSNSYFNRSGAGSPQNTNRGRSESRSIEDLEDMME